MAIVETLTPARKRFFEELGIFRDDDIPKSFFDVIRSYSLDYTEGEKFCLDDYNIAYCEKKLFSVKDVIGTNHERYMGKTWLEAFLELDRGEKLLELYFNNPEYYDDLKKEANCDFGLACKNGQYYILDRAGGGNNRLIIMKIKYLALASKENCDLEKLNKEFSFMGRVRTSPSEEIAQSIFYLMFFDGGYEASGYQVLNKSVSMNEPLFDIVIDFPVAPQIVYENVGEEELAKLSKSISTEKNKKR